MDGHDINSQTRNGQGPDFAQAAIPGFEEIENLMHQSLKGTGGNGEIQYFSISIFQFLANRPKTVA